MMRIALLYTVFALIATLVNLVGQEAWVRTWQGPWPKTLALCVGTGLGLITKYVLDKRYIFQFESKSVGHDSKTFLLYSVMGLATTATFWTFELSFDAIFGTRVMRYCGGAIGLAIGYVIKYFLDKHLVFIHSRNMRP